ncbi:class III lanthionine synthetase LanKC [Cryobacterium sp. Y50]|uniref:class III lanthionine synthetase LanKC n=1 Tax=Cryobacterium sp. Y50 TaxID=2048286 RepID=UPI000CE361E7|nr:class III lanthionine synthetase LanKC [Cryobacterium sp. Y50]
MDLHYIAYAGAHSPFYEPPQSAGEDLVEFAGTPPEGYRKDVNREWCGWSVPGGQLPTQGWKIHVSATTETARRVLTRTLAYCTQHRIDVKFLHSMSTLGRRNSKYGDRGGSGKFITIYPADERQLETILNDLDGEIGGEAGPSILSDLRWREGPLYVRYGAFVLRFGRNEQGQQVPCMEAPDGTLVPDERRPGFHPPEWAPLPDFLDEALEARARGTLEDFPFIVKSAIHFSNGGGVYLADDTRTGLKVILKEARPFAGIDEADVDAVDRLIMERDALELLAGVPGVPRLVDFRRGHAHQFLAREYVEGAPLSVVMHRMNPALPGARVLGASDYVEWAKAVFAKVEAGVDAMHQRGVVFGDLHPGNIIVDEDDEVGFIDFEAASPVEEDRAQRIGAPGFRAPAAWTGVRVDEFALANLRLALFLPMTETLVWSPTLTPALFDAAVRRFPDAEEFLEPSRRLLMSVWGDAPLVQSEPADVRDRLAAGTFASALPERTDRLYPGDIAQFQSPTGGIEFAFGAAGVLWTLNRAGYSVPDDHVDWLVARLRGNDLIGPGLFEGAAGVGLVLRALGAHEDADAALARAAGFPVDKLDATLWRGIPGLGLALLDDRSEASTERAVFLAAELRERRTPPPAGLAGLLHGGAGRALFLLALAEATGDAQWSADAMAEVDRDLELLRWTPTAPLASGGAWQQPALAAGSPGIALVARRLQQVDDDPRWAQIVDQVRGPDGVLSGGLLPHVGLLRGRAGAGLMLAELWRGESMPTSVARTLERHRQDCMLGVVPFSDGMLPFGDHSLKLSADWATGAAGLIAAFEGMAGAGFEFPGHTARAGVAVR